MKRIQTAIIMGSDSDLPAMEDAIATFKEFAIACEVRVISAHRTPAQLHEYLPDAEKRGVQVFLAAAGGAAHLPGVIASLTTRPVIGLPMQTSAFQGIDSILSILQMPGGVPVGTMAVGKAGARNGALFAAAILALNDSKLRKKLEGYRKAQADSVIRKDAEVRSRT